MTKITPLFLAVTLFFTFHFSLNAQAPTCPGDGFGGNKSTLISAITPNIYIPDSAGEAPFAVYASAFQSTGTGSTDPFSDIEYSWDFGDNSATGNQAFPHGVDSTMMVANSDQQGPEASYLYETPGTYTLTMTARAWDGSNYVTSSTSKTITVTSWSGQDRYFDPTGGNDNDTGTSAGTAWQSWPQLATWLDGGNNRRALIKRGDSLVVTSTFNTKKSALRIGAYGTGNKPILKVDPSLGSSNIINLNVGNNTVSDHVYTDLVFDLDAIGASGFFAYVNTGGNLNRVTLAKCQFKNGNTSSLIITTGGGPKNSMMIWDCIINANQGEKQGLYVYQNRYFSIMGGYYDGGDGNAILDHHMYINESDHSLIRWVRFGPAIQRSFCLNMNCPSTGTETNYILIDGCDVTGTSNGIDFSNSNNNNAGHFSHVIVQNTSIHDLNSGFQGIGMMGYSILNITVRNNRFYNIPVADFDMRDPALVFSVYRNRFYNPSPNSRTSIKLVPGQGGTFRDNIFENQASGGGHFTGDFGANSNWTFAGNQYWHPNISNPYYDSSTPASLNFTGWQGIGHDVNGTLSNPMFPNPANGDFGQLPQANFSSVIMFDTASFINQTTMNPTGWPISYSWDFGDGSASDTASNPIHVYGQAGSFPAILSATNACGTDTAVYIQVTDILNAIDDAIEATSLVLYPNPARDFLKVAGIPYSSEKVSLEVYDMSMRLIRIPIQEININEFRIDTEALPSGAYLLKLTAGDWQETRKFIRL